MINLPKAEEGHMTFGEDEFTIWRDVKRITEFNKVLEIGLNAGHSASIVLEMFPTSIVHSIDINLHDYTSDAVTALKEAFGDRFGYIEGNSTTCSYFKDYYDLAFIDGSHVMEHCMADIVNCKRANIPYLLVDDFNYPDVRIATEKLKLARIKEWLYTNEYGQTAVALFRG